MTIICYRAGLMAADRGSWEGDMLHAQVRKIARSPAGGLIGATGNTVDCHRVLRWAEDGAVDDDFPKKTTAEALLVAPGGDVWFFELGGIAQIHGEFFAIGSGMQFALGAMAAGASAEAAVRLCYGRVAHVGGEVDVVRLEEATIASIRRAVKRTR